MKDIQLKVGKNGTIGISEIVTSLEETKDEYLSLVRRVYPYKIPKGYMGWRSLSAIIAIGVIGQVSRKIFARSGDLASFLHAHKCALWFVQSAPVYCLKPGILNSLLQTDILNSKEILKDLKPQISSFLLLFPQGSIISSEGSPVDFCVVHLSDRLYPENSQGSAHGVDVHYLSHEHEINLHWSSVDQVGNVWFSGMGLYPDGRVEYGNDSVGLNTVESADAIFLSKMRSLVLQCFLLMQYEPEAISFVQEAETERKGKPKGFAQPQAEKKSFLYPRWLSEPTKAKSPRTNSGTTGTHASPSVHWRRGHWRNAVVGEGRAERKWVWVRPTLVAPAE